MKALVATTLLFGVAALGLPPCADAGPNLNAKICLHTQSVVAKNACNRTLPAIWQVETRAMLLPSAYYIYLLVLDGYAQAGIGGLQCGIQYNNAVGAGVDIYSWHLCATLEFASTGWPASGGGNLITWDTAARCQRTEPGGIATGVTALAGYFYCAAYTPDLFRVVPRPVDGSAKVADCQSNEDLIGGGTFPPGLSSHLGSVNFTAAGTTPGYCLAGDPVEPTTWSKVKALHAR